MGKYCFLRTLERFIFAAFDVQFDEVAVTEVQGIKGHQFGISRSYTYMPSASVTFRMVASHIFFIGKPTVERDGFRAVMA